MLRLQSCSIKSRLWVLAQDINFLIHENNNQQLLSPDPSPGLRETLADLPSSRGTCIGGWKAASRRGQAATSPRTGMEHPLLVLIEGSQVRVMTRGLQLMSARDMRTVRIARTTALPLTPRPQGQQYKPG